MKQKKYTEEEIIEIINNWELRLGDKLTKTHRYVEKGDIKELKSKFMTPQGFRKAIDKARLVGAQFD